MSKNKMNQVQHRSISGEIRAIEENSRSFELSFSSEVPVDRWFGQEILSHDVEAVDMKRLNDVGVVLFSHGRDNNYGRMPIASIDEVWNDTAERRLKAKITFDDDEDSEKVYKKVSKGMIKGVSFGYSVSSWEEVKAGKTSVNGRFTGPAYIGIKWEPFEISIEPTPADPSVGVGRDIENEDIEKPKIEEPKQEKPTINDSWFFNLRKKINQ